MGEMSNLRADHTAVAPENIPDELRLRPQWVCWRYQPRGDGKPTKVPYRPDGAKASSTDLLTWSPFEACLAALETGRFDGIGFVFSSADPYCSVDLDDCRDPDTGELEPWAEDVLADLPDAYAEVSPSGCGVHLIVKGRVPPGGNKSGPFEMYHQDRFLTITGHVLGVRR